jgi:hypothetical protein
MLSFFVNRKDYSSQIFIQVSQVFGPSASLVTSSPFSPQAAMLNSITNAISSVQRFVFLIILNV